MLKFNTSILLLIYLFLCSCQQNNYSNNSEIAPQSIPSFEIAPGFKIELVVSEPLISDPVAMTIDEYGNWYVVEMHGYPTDKSRTGKVIFLEDIDKDGLPDKSTVFAEGLTLPTGIMRWKKGVIITDSPDVIYLEDTDGDRKADKKEIQLTGFSLSNPQHNMNSPMYGLDGWIYLGHEGATTPKVFMEKFGDDGNEIRFKDIVDGPVLPKNALGRNVRFKPDSHELEMMSGKTQFGHTFDPWGHHVSNSNEHHLFHEVIDASYLARNPALVVKNTTHYMPDYGQPVEVFPLTDNPEHQLLTSVGVMTSACGVTWYTGGAFDDFDNSTFVAEPVHNLVRVDNIYTKGAVMFAKPRYKEKEFLRSKDSWFRPVNFYIGPDGAIYLIDYYRQYIEHPEWMSEKMMQSGALYNGMDKGRIYRISPENMTSMNWLNNLSLGEATSEELIGFLDHPNSWWRLNAHRILMDRKPENLSKELASLISSAKNSSAKIHVLWILEELGQQTKKGIQNALQDTEAGVRETAIKIAEKHLSDFPDLEKDLLNLKNDPYSKVRLQLLLTLGEINDDKAKKASLEILKKDLESEWFHLAILSHPNNNNFQFFSKAIQELDNNKIEGKRRFISSLSATITRNGDKKILKNMIDLAVQKNTPSDIWWQSSVLQGIAQGMKWGKSKSDGMAAQKQQILSTFSASTHPEIRRAGIELLKVIGLPEVHAKTMKQALKIALDPQEIPDMRIDALSLLTLTNNEMHLIPLKTIIASGTNKEIQRATLQVLTRLEGTNIILFLLDKWKELLPDIRNEALKLFMESPERMLVLLEAIDNNKIQASSVEWSRKTHLMNHRSSEIKLKARRLFQKDEEQRRKELQKYQIALSVKGNTANGKKLFNNYCNICHQMNGEGGINFGPDLGSLRNRSKSSLMEDILNPSKSIADGYDSWTITLQNGTVKAGIISTENSTSLTLKDIVGKELTIPRDEIIKMQAAELSVMPLVLDNQISPSEMADLLAFIKNELK